MAAGPTGAGGNAVCAPDERLRLPALLAREACRQVGQVTGNVVWNLGQSYNSVSCSNTCISYDVQHAVHETQAGGTRQDKTCSLLCTGTSRCGQSAAHLPFCIQVLCRPRSGLVQTCFHPVRPALPQLLASLLRAAASLGR